MTYHVSQFCPQTWEIAPMVSRTPIDCLKTSALRADRFTLFLSMWVVTVLCAFRAKMLTFREHFRDHLVT
jgi:hypothetical protein